MSRRTVFLFDLDGVLVEPHGYRLSVAATLDFFTARMGFGSLYPGEDVMALLESISMTSEWDMVPVCLAAIFDALLAQAPDLILPADLFAACEAVRERHLQPPQVDYRALAAILAPAFQPGRVYSRLALELNQPGQPHPPFPRLLGSPLLETLLADTRDLDTPTTRVFQNFALGSLVFAQSYRESQVFDAPSYLQTHDRPLLEPGLRDRLVALWRDGRLDLAIYTLRANYPRQAVDQARLAYGREAELVVESLGLDELPLIGYGEVAAAAEQIGCLPDSLCKPSPVHALGAILSALTRDERRSLLAAADLARGDGAGSLADLPGDLRVHVFEDSAGSVRAVRQVGELLKGLGISVQIHAWGIAANPDKVAALRSAGAQIYPTVNPAIERALEISQ